MSRPSIRQLECLVAVADHGSFRKAAEIDKRQGLKAEYYKGRRIRPDDKVDDRLDTQVNFDFGTESPVPGKTEDYEFSIHWEIHPPSKVSSASLRRQ